MLFCIPCIPIRQKQRRHKLSKGSCSAFPLLFLFLPGKWLGTELAWAEMLAVGHEGLVEVGIPQKMQAAKDCQGSWNAGGLAWTSLKFGFFKITPKTPKQTNKQTQIQTPNDKTNPNTLKVFC